MLDEDECISNGQSAFIFDRSILDAMSAIKTIHYMKSKFKGKKYVELP